MELQVRNHEIAKIKRKQCLAHAAKRLAGLTNGALLLEATPAQHGTALRRLERDRSFRTALRTNGARFRARVAGSGGALCLAVLAPFGVILKLLVEKEELFTGREHEIVSAINALQDLIDELHPLPRLPAFSAKL
ncbi:MAG TPA: hypothetical protein VME68_04775 [Acidobacteriaceae bacterium]|nr:hypothetical protein [Acidobacteriaceae bacterium]